MLLDSLRDKILRNLADKQVQLKYRLALPDNFPMPKKEFLHPKFDVETWDTLVKAYIESLEILKTQAISEIENPKEPVAPWMRKNPSTGLFENDYE